MMATVRWWNGLMEDLPVDEARAAVNSGHAWYVSAPPETAMIEHVAEQAVIAAPKPRRATARRRKLKGS